jgi:thiol-disulfide isomerase/thioredoxin
MKNIYLSLIIFLLPLLVTSQEKVRAIALEDPAFNTYFNNGATAPIVKGKLVNANAEEISQSTISYSIVTPFSDLEIERVTKVAKDGTFKLTLDYAFPYQQTFIEVGDYCHLALLANKDLFIELDVKKLKALKDSDDNFEGVTYTGTDSKLNAYIHNCYQYKHKEVGQLHSKMYLLINDKNLDSSIFIKQYDSVFAEFERIDKEYISANPSPYSWIPENERLSDYYGGICHRYWGKPMGEILWKRVCSHKSFLVSYSGMQFYNYLYWYLSSSVKSPSVSWDEIFSIKDLNKTEKSIIDSVNYYYKIRAEKLPYDTARSFQLMMKLSSRLNQLLTEKVTTKIVHCLDSLFAPSKADFLKLRISSKDPAEQKEMYTYILPKMQTSWTKKILTIEYQQTVNKIAAMNSAINMSLQSSSTKVISLGLGDPIMQFPFGASLYKISGMHAADFIAKLRLAFPGKALILDCWATWCGACLLEMPFSKTLHENLKGQPVEFIYLCTSAGSDETLWETKIAKLKQPGIHFFVDQRLETELMNRFSLNVYPSYLFFSKNGQYKPGVIKLISAINKDQLAALINEEPAVKQ